MGYYAKEIILLLRTNITEYLSTKKIFNDETIEELAQSIKAYGIIHLSVEKNGQ